MFGGRSGPPSRRGRSEDQPVRSSAPILTLRDAGRLAEDWSAIPPSCTKSAVEPAARQGEPCDRRSARASRAGPPSDPPSRPRRPTRRVGGWPCSGSPCRLYGAPSALPRRCSSRCRASRRRSAACIPRRRSCRLDTPRRGRCLPGVARQAAGARPPSGGTRSCRGWESSCRRPCDLRRRLGSHFHSDEQVELVLHFFRVFEAHRERPSGLFPAEVFVVLFEVRFGGSAFPDDRFLYAFGLFVDQAGRRGHHVIFDWHEDARTRECFLPAYFDFEPNAFEFDEFSPPRRPGSQLERGFLGFEFFIPPFARQFVEDDVPVGPPG